MTVVAVDELFFHSLVIISSVSFVGTSQKICFVVLKYTKEVGTKDTLDFLTSICRYTYKLLRCLKALLDELHAELIGSLLEIEFDIVKPIKNLFIYSSYCILYALFPSTALFLFSET